MNKMTKNKIPISWLPVGRLLLSIVVRLQDWEVVVGLTVLTVWWLQTFGPVLTPGGALVWAVVWVGLSERTRWRKEQQQKARGRV